MSLYVCLCYRWSGIGLLSFSHQRQGHVADWTAHLRCWWIGPHFVPRPPPVEPHPPQHLTERLSLPQLWSLQRVKVGRTAQSYVQNWHINFCAYIGRYMYAHRSSNAACTCMYLCTSLTWMISNILIWIITPIPYASVAMGTTFK